MAAIRLVKCADCLYFGALYAHGNGPGFCDNPKNDDCWIKWSTDDRYCKHYQPKSL